MGENICKQRGQQGINLQNTQTAHAAQYKKINNRKIGGRSRDISPKRTYRWPKAQEKILNITNY